MQRRERASATGEKARPSSSSSCSSTRSSEHLLEGFGIIVSSSSTRLDRAIEPCNVEKERVPPAKRRVPPPPPPSRAHGRASTCWKGLGLSFRRRVHVSIGPSSHATSRKSECHQRTSARFLLLLLLEPRGAQTGCKCSSSPLVLAPTTTTCTQAHLDLVFLALVLVGRLPLALDLLPAEHGVERLGRDRDAAAAGVTASEKRARGKRSEERSEGRRGGEERRRRSVERA